MQNFLTKAVSHLDKIFPTVYNTRTKRGSYHFAFAFRRNKIIAIGVNRPERFDSKAFKFAKKFNLEEKKRYSYLHAEESLISRLIGLDEIDYSLNIVVLRINKFGILGESKPCENCRTILSAYGFTKVWYSTKNSNIERLIQ